MSVPGAEGADRGAGGRGLEVGKVASGLVAESMTLYLRGSETVGHDKVSEVRSALEIPVSPGPAPRRCNAGLIPMRRTDDGLAFPARRRRSSRRTPGPSALA
jgi:hypothetical protein